ncbi:tetratricopeptide repeat-containing sulfotransferase family protein [Pseudoxanthomonas sp. 10H]|uniref:tetratricopeptide repeat-containing sulfotransferase family protein n=1 Tax=Pseudoxanthomonas sp. 10H TaxID=3242729 RepID=UPI003558C565
MNQSIKVFDRLNEAKKLIDAGNLDQARKVNASILAARPGNTAAWLQASRLEGLAGHYRLARDHALRAFAGLGGQERGGVVHMLRRLQSFNLGGEIIRLVDSLDDASLNPQMADAIATALNHLNQPTRAIDIIDRGLRMAPDSIELRLTRAHTLVFLGRLDEAEAEMDRCMQRVPEIGFGWWTLSRLRKQRPDANHVDAIRRQVGLSAQNPANLTFLAYALHKEFDDLGDYAEATKALDLACRTRRAHIPYSSDETRRIFEGLSRIGDSTTAHGIDASRTPVFILGMHRSGTTLLEQLLDGHSRVSGLGELYEFTAQMRYATDHGCKGVIDSKLVARADAVDYEAVGRGYLDSIEWRCGPESHFIDKLPSNFLNIGFICRALPHARILHMVRDPMETCFSNLREYFADNTNHYSYNRTELGEFFNHYRQLMAHWHRAFPGRIMDVHYSRLTSDTANTLRDVAQFCGLEFEEAMLDLQGSARAVTTASAVQVRQGVVALEKPRWLPYSDYLLPLSDVLADGAG